MGVMPIQLLSRALLQDKRAKIDLQARAMRASRFKRLAQIIRPQHIDDAQMRMLSQLGRISGGTEKGQEGFSRLLRICFGGSCLRLIALMRQAESNGQRKQGSNKGDTKRSFAGLAHK